MPSGAKKRKAAKKNKVIQPHLVHSSTNNQQDDFGNEEVKSKDERDSDGGESGSPVSQDRNSSKNENEVVEKKGEDSVELVDGGNESVAVVGSQDICERKPEDEEVVEGAGVIESKEGSKGKRFGVEHVMSVKDSYDGNNGSAGFGEDVPQVVEEEHIAAYLTCEATPSDGSVKPDSTLKDVTVNSEEYVDVTQVSAKKIEEENGPGISVLEAAPSDSHVELIDTKSKEVIGVTEEYIGDCSAAKKKSEEENRAAGLVLERGPIDGSVKSIDVITKEVTAATQENIDKSQFDMKSENEYVSANLALETVSSDGGTLKSNDSVSNGVSDVAEKASMQEANDSDLVTSPIVDAIKLVGFSSEEVEVVQESALVEEPSVRGSNSKESNSKETRDNTLSNINEVSGDSSALKTEEVILLSDANVQALSTAAVSAKENETALSSRIPHADTKGKDNGIETGTSECSKNKPFVSSVPPQAGAKTSWLSCCGLFDVVLGANR